MTTDQTWYYVNEDSCEPLQPSFKSNLISLYGLDDISQSVARTNVDGSKGVKLRKSYKNHVSDLSGKHNIHSERKTLLPVLFGPISASGSDFAPFDHDYLQRCIKFEKSPSSGVSGFDSANLAIDDKKPRQIEATAEPRKRTKTSSPAQPPPLKKRHVQVHFR